MRSSSVLKAVAPHSHTRSTSLMRHTSRVTLHCITRHAPRSLLRHHHIPIIMVRLSALLLFSLFATSYASLLPTSEQQQLVTNQNGPVHATQGWSWEDCGQSLHRLCHLLFILPLFQGFPTDAVQIDSISVFPDPPSPGQNLTVLVNARAQKEVEVCPRAYPLFVSSLIGALTFRRERTLMFR